MCRYGSALEIEQELLQHTKQTEHETETGNQSSVRNRSALKSLLMVQNWLPTAAALHSILNPYLSEVSKVEVIRDVCGCESMHLYIACTSGKRSAAERMFCYNLRTCRFIYE